MICHAQVMRRLIARGFDVNHRFGWTSETVFHVHPSPALLTVMLDAGLDPAATSASGRTLLHAAENPKSVRLLIEAGAAVNARHRQGWTPLHSAENPEVATALLEAGADWTLKDEEGRTAAQYNQEMGDESVAQAIEAWVSGHRRAAALGEALAEAELQGGPGL